MLFNHPASTDTAEPLQVEIMDRVDFVSYLTTAFLLFFMAFTGMLLVGSLHSRHPEIPLISYWDAVCGVWILGIIGQAVRPAHRTWSRKAGR